MLLVTFVFIVTKYLIETTQKKKNLFLLMVSEVSVHHDGEGMVGKRSSHHKIH
jgi:hypothetical protein